MFTRYSLTFRGGSQALKAAFSPPPPLPAVLGTGTLDLRREACPYILVTGTASVPPPMLPLGAPAPPPSLADVP